MPTWWGLTVGAVIGVFFGLVFGGNRKWRVWDYIFGSEQIEEGSDDGDEGTSARSSAPK